MYLAAANDVVVSNTVELFSFGPGKWLTGNDTADDDNYYPAFVEHDKDLIILETQNLPDSAVTVQVKNHTPVALGAAIRLLHSAGKLKVSVIHHDMGTVANTGDFTFKGNKKMLFALDAPSGKQKEPKDHKLKADLFGAKLSAAKVRSSATLQVLFRVKAFPKKGVTELAPVRPMAVLRARVSLKAGQAVRLL